jgi:hypothetical protein
MWQMDAGWRCGFMELGLLLGLALVSWNDIFQPRLLRQIGASSAMDTCNMGLSVTLCLSRLMWY